MKVGRYVRVSDISQVQPQLRGIHPNVEISLATPYFAAPFREKPGDFYINFPIYFLIPANQSPYR